MCLHPIKNLTRVWGESLESYGTQMQTSESMRGIYYHDFHMDQ